ncbi:MAG TPA: DUF5691 domain-containing protein, partial [Chthoniobacterales bacterium]|nr:DUF5691 domain-containing protein [Chthoniobacterales bacterium]
MSSWNDYTTAALLGTGKAAPLPLPAPLESTLSGHEASEREVEFLTRAGALALWRQAGFRPRRTEWKNDPAPAETTVPVSRTSADHLRAMLAGRCRIVLPEWLGAAAFHERHVPPELLPALLDLARQDGALRSLAFRAGGKRAQWLVAYNPAWGLAVSDQPVSWETGNREQRLAILRELRATDPEGARVRIEAEWKSEPADIRAEFLTELKSNLSDADASFLDSALDDRSKEVRRVVVDLLARLPASLFAARMLARAQPLLAWKRGGLLSRASIEVALPGEQDSIAARDGLDSKIFGSQKVFGEKAVVLILILSTVPLSHWETEFQAAPDTILKAAEKNEFVHALITGWGWAALRQRNAKWGEALLDFPIEPQREFLPGESLLSILPAPAQVKRLVAALRAEALKKRDSAGWHSLSPLLEGYPGEWPPMLAREVLSALRIAAAEGISWQFRPIAESLATRLPIPMLAEAAAGWPIDQEGVSNLVDLLTFRHDAL